MLQTWYEGAGSPGLPNSGTALTPTPNSKHRKQQRVVVLVSSGFP